MTECRYLFIGHPRCGSKSLANALQSAGLDIPHEHLGADGMVSWWQTGFLSRKGNLRFIGIKDDSGRKSIPVRHIFHYVRNPANAIPSIVVENEFNERDNNSFRFRRKKILDWYGIDIGKCEPDTAAAISYTLWNERAASFADHAPLRIEDPERILLSGAPRELQMPNVNKTKRKFGIDKPTVDLNALLPSLTPEERTPLERYINLYSRN